jgi:hypothetical protein
LFSLQKNLLALSPSIVQYRVAVAPLLRNWLGIGLDDRDSFLLVPLERRDMKKFSAVLFNRVIQILSSFYHLILKE